MDRGTKKMDKSPLASDSLPLFRVDLPARPLSPWLRLAHVTGAEPGAGLRTAMVRELIDFELVFQFEGSTWVWDDDAGGSVDVPAGSVAFLPPRFKHAWAHEPGWHIAVHFDLHAQPKLVPMDHIRMVGKEVRRTPQPLMRRFRLGVPGAAESFEFPLITPVRSPVRWRDRLEPLVGLYQRRAHHTWTAQLLAGEVLSWALRTLAEDAAAGSAQAGADTRILALLRALDNPTGPFFHARPSVEELAEHAAMGLTAFREAFLKTTGRGPRQYIEEQRLERAARALLETSLSVNEIAAAEGYDDPYHFSRAFKRVMGASPRAYRRKAQG